jgi:hypothetical protein
LVRWPPVTPSGFSLFVLFLFWLSGPDRALGDITGSRHGLLMKTLAALAVVKQPSQARADDAARDDPETDDLSY